MSDGVAGTYLNAPAQPARGRVEGTPQAAIAEAARRTGTDFGYLLAQAQIESGLNPTAQARSSSASGLFQFIDQTWLATLDRHGGELGYGALADAIETTDGRARITNPAMRQTIMDLRLNPLASSLMAGALATDNGAALEQQLGRAPDSSELYLAHFLGAPSALRFLDLLQSGPEQSAVAAFPQAAAANPAIFRHRSGAPRSVSEVMGVIRNRMATAMAQGPAPSSNDFRARAPQTNGAPAPFMPPTLPFSRGPLPSMAETLRNSFGLDGNAAADMPGLDHIRTAYARLGAMGL